MSEKPNYYSILPANVRYDKQLKDKAKLLYGEITALCNKEGMCYASNKYFASLYNVSTTTISLLIKNLIEKGYIESEIVYKENTKEIEYRYLKILKEGYLKNLKEGIKENLKDNNTRINNTRNKYIYSRVIEYLNNKIGTSYKSTTKSTQSHINARLDEGFTENDFIKVIDKKVKEWKDTKMEKFLRPETLFSTKFESYLNQKEEKENEWWKKYEN